MLRRLPPQVPERSSPRRMGSETILDFAFEKIDRDLAYVMGCFHDVLVEQGQHDLAERLPWTGRQPPGPRSGGTPAAEQIEREVQVLSMAFQLLNMVEENAAAQARRRRESTQGLLEEAGHWGSNLRRLLQAGFSAEVIAQALPRIRVEPVLTAHPTEAKRQTVLEQHRELYLLLVKRENQMWTPAEQEAIRAEFTAALERLWRTGEIRMSKPDVAAERRSAMHYLRDIFPEALPRVDQRLRQAWRELGLPRALIDRPRALPRVTFGTWVGGDRDGHPLVTARTTHETLLELRRAAVQVHHHHLRALGVKLSLSERLQPPPPSLRQAIERVQTLLGTSGAEAVARNPNEPWRQWCNLLQARLPEVHEPEDASGARTGRYRHPGELLADLATLRESLRAVNATRLVDTLVVPVERAVETFGFHLASLDIRQNSAVHEQALAQLLQAAGIDGASIASWSEKDRLALLDGELRSPRPLAHAEASANGQLGSQAAMVLDCCQVVARHRALHGIDGIGAFIVSMTRSLSDLLTVYILLREVGLVRWIADVPGGEGLASEIPVVPLFETIADLEGAPDILRAFLAHPVTRRSLALQSAGRARPEQQVMLGYSDSCKDGGIFASQWHLHRAQERIAAVGREVGVDIRFFHGRGGTVSRGAGPTHRFLEALPHGSLHGDLRLTEQGETIAQKYANLITATYNLELLVAGTATTTLEHTRPGRSYEDCHEVLDRFARTSRLAYEALLAHDGFMTYFSEATPIDVLEQAAIGSRPARRTGRRTLADLRAIPWVFSWNQSRHYLPGWYGIGAGLQELHDSDPQGFRLLAARAIDWPFLRYALSNIESNIASVALDLMAEYAALVQDTQVRSAIYGLIADEFRRTSHMLELVFGGSPMTARRPRMVRTVQLRDTGLRALHAHQVALLRQWRAARAAKDPEADRLLPTLLLSVNAIASGLRTTG